jgi:chemotaxis protein MotA
MADKARGEGLLSLEEDAQTIGDEFARKGLMLMIDGTDPEALKSILEIEIEIEGGVAREHEKAEVFKAGSGYAPTLGVLGAVIGLIRESGRRLVPRSCGRRQALPALGAHRSLSEGG